jgi:hypothetical protein
MPYVVQSGGGYPLRSHAFKIVPPLASKKFGMPNSCQNGGCHQQESLEWVTAAFDRHYPDFYKQADGAGPPNTGKAQ